MVRRGRSLPCRKARRGFGRPQAGVSLRPPAPLLLAPRVPHPIHVVGSATRREVRLVCRQGRVGRRGFGRLGGRGDWGGPCRLPLFWKKGAVTSHPGRRKGRPSQPTPKKPSSTHQQGRRGQGCGVLSLPGSRREVQSTETLGFRPPFARTHSHSVTPKETQWQKKVCFGHRPPTHLPPGERGTAPPPFHHNC